MSTDRSRRGLTDDDASSPLSLDPRAILGVGPDVTARELRTAYRRALLAAHPDQGGSREELDLVRSAYDRLRGSARPDGPPAPTSPPTSRDDTAPRTTASGPVLVDTSTPEVGPISTADAPAASASERQPAPASSAPTMTPANARAAAKFVTAQRFAAAGEPSPPPRRRRTNRRRSRFEQLLERELVRRSDRRVRLAGATDHAGAGA